MRSNLGLGVAALAALWLVQACTGRGASFSDPKAVLRDYISESFNTKSLQDRDGLLRYLTGAARNRLAAWSDQQFNQAFIQSRRKFIELEFESVKPAEDDSVGITYKLTFFDRTKGEDTKVIHRKLAQLTRREQRWYIVEVRNLTESIEYKNEMSLP
jgi:hypothetical protein